MMNNKKKYKIYKEDDRLEVYAVDTILSDQVENEEKLILSSPIKS